MIDRLGALIVDESKWLTVSMSFALLVSAILMYRQRQSGLPSRRLILTAMNLFFAITIGAMALGHLLAVSVKFAMGTLQGSPWILYLIGIALAAPSWSLIYHTVRFMTSKDDFARKTLILNGWLTVTLLSLGIHNLPIAIPGILNIWYQLHSGRIIGWTIVCITILVNVSLFIGSVMFFASGQSFEEFRGIQ